jgi:hypothetical protein
LCKVTIFIAPDGGMAFAAVRLFRYPDIQCRDLTLAPTIRAFYCICAPAKLISFFEFPCHEYERVECLSTTWATVCAIIEIKQLRAPGWHCRNPETLILF